MGLLGGRSSKEAAPTLGYLQGFADKYELQRQLGKGGNGVVRLAVQRETGREYAVKSIPKVLRDPAASERKRASQIPYIKQEVEVLLALRGALNVANLEEVYEDATHVHMVMELCRGGELVAEGTQGRHYSERTVASYMRAVIRVLALCHAKDIVHRDIKPENFLLLSADPQAPVKAIDFGLATFFDPANLPLTGLNVEGTPWYLAPEACRAKWYPASDVWSCGIMAAYLLTGRYPFNDRISPDMPDLARTLRVICFEALDLSRPEYEGLSPQALDFLTVVLNKDPLQRPSAAAALEHPWLAGGSARERGAGAALDRSVVQRLQRFGASSAFKRTVLQHIAQDLVAMHFSAEPTAHGGAVFRERSVHGGAALRERSLHGGSAVRERSFHGGLAQRERSQHGGNRALASPFAGLATSPFAQANGNGGSVHGSLHGGRSGGGGVLPLNRSKSGGAGSQLPAGEPSAHGSSELAGLAVERSKSTGSGLLQQGSLSVQGSVAGAAASLPPLPLPKEERTVRGGRAASGVMGLRGSGNGSGEIPQRAGSFLERSVRAGSEFVEKSLRGGTAFLERAFSVGSARGGDKSVRGGGGGGSMHRLDSSVFLPVATPYSRRLADLMDKLGLKSGGKIDQAELTKALQGIGYRISEEEGAELFGTLDVERHGQVGQAELSAGLMDWKAFQDTYKDRWLESVRRVFAEMDADGSGVLSAEEIAAALGDHLSPYEVDAAVHLALLEAAHSSSDKGGAAGCGGAASPAAGIDFEHFLSLLRAGSETLDTFEDRLSNHTSRHNTRDLSEAAAKALRPAGRAASKRDKASSGKLRSSTSGKASSSVTSAKSGQASARGGAKSGGCACSVQ